MSAAGDGRAEPAHVMHHKCVFVARPTPSYPHDIGIALVAHEPIAEKSKACLFVRISDVCTSATLALDAVRILFPYKMRLAMEQGWTRVQAQT